MLRHSVYENATLANLVTTSAPCDAAGWRDMLLELKTEGVISGILHTVNVSPSTRCAPKGRTSSAAALT